MGVGLINKSEIRPSYCQLGNTIWGQALKQPYKVHILRVRTQSPPIAYLYGIVISNLGGSDKFYKERLGSAPFTD